MKRVFDLISSLVAILLLSPLLIAVCAVIYAMDRVAIIYRQTRVGLHGKEFGIFKFMSMVPNADKIGGYSTETNDPRITSIGRFIRKTSIDELPQLVNVILGDMSIVGPRPDVPAQRANYTQPEWEKRTSVKPGITGLAQATMRSDATEAERKNLDFQYVEQQEFLFDMKIILMTIRQVLFRGGN